MSQKRKYLLNLMHDHVQTQERIADDIGYCRKSYYNLVIGKTKKISKPKMEQMAKVLNTPFDVLLAQEMLYQKSLFSSQIEIEAPQENPFQVMVLERLERFECTIQKLFPMIGGGGTIYLILLNKPNNPPKYSLLYQM
jgi:transcriptional regulator with XRE-family HTH domain